jgi:acetyltransferase EpsM
MRRRRVVEQVERCAPALGWAAIVHRSAILSPSAQVGPGSVVFPGAIVNCRTALGRHVIINTGSIIEHDNRFEDFSSTGPGVCTGGNVRVGELSHIGIGASVCHGIAIGANSVVGGQAFVNRDLGDDLVSFGVPARPRHQRALGAVYL